MNTLAPPVFVCEYDRTVQETFKARIGMVRSAPKSKPWVKAFVEMIAENARLARVKQQNTPTNQ